VEFYDIDSAATPLGLLRRGQQPVHELRKRCYPGCPRPGPPPSGDRFRAHNTTVVAGTITDVGAWGTFHSIHRPEPSGSRGGSASAASGRCPLPRPLPLRVEFGNSNLVNLPRAERECTVSARAYCSQDPLVLADFLHAVGPCSELPGTRPSKVVDPSGAACSCNKRGGRSRALHQALPCLSRASQDELVGSGPGHDVTQHVAGRDLPYRRPLPHPAEHPTPPRRRLSYLSSARNPRLAGAPRGRTSSLHVVEPQCRNGRTPTL